LLVDRASEEELRERLGDAALTAVLRTKPDDDQVPTSVWWLIAESLRTSVAIRRALTARLPVEPHDMAVLVTEAGLLTDLALAELTDATGARPALAQVSEPVGRPEFGLQVGVLVLARMLVSHRVTSPQRLANVLAAHRRALATIGLPGRDGVSQTDQPSNRASGTDSASSISVTAR
jgi:hypothetical protein